MNSLIINTANDELYMVLKAGDQIFSKQGESFARHNETMIPMLESLLKESELTIQDINQFGVIIGLVIDNSAHKHIGTSSLDEFRNLRVGYGFTKNLIHISIHSEVSHGLALVHHSDYFGIFFHFVQNFSLTNVLVFFKLDRFAVFIHILYRGIVFVYFLFLSNFPRFFV